MGFKEIKSLDADTVISIGGENKKTRKQNPKSIEGFYLGSKTVKSPKSKSGEAKIHIFQTAKGDVGVWGKTDMDRKMGTATPGAMTRVAFDKMKSTPNGDMYTYKVEQDDSFTIEVEGLQTSANDIGNNDDNDSDGSYSEQSKEYNDDDDTATEDEEDAVQAAALAAQERKAKVQALLNKGKGANTKN